MFVLSYKVVKEHQFKMWYSKMCFNECKCLKVLMQILSVGRINFDDTPLISPTAKFSFTPIFSTYSIWNLTIKLAIYYRIDTWYFILFLATWQLCSLINPLQHTFLFHGQYQWWFKSKWLQKITFKSCAKPISVKAYHMHNWSDWFTIHQKCQFSAQSSLQLRPTSSMQHMCHMHMHFQGIRAHLCILILQMFFGV